MQNTIGQPQSVQVPNYSGVNIQIFNPAVAAPGASLPAQSATTNNYSTNPCYPANYYTQSFNTQPPQGPPQPQSQAGAIPAKEVTPPAQTAEPEKKKTEKREIVQLTDDYIKNLENYLNSQDPEIRVMGGKEVVARLQEDNSRKEDPALNALVNKMLQDPSQKVKIMAFAALNSRIATGDNTTVELLKGIQQQKTGYGQDAQDATELLLKMSGSKVQKEFEVTDKPKKEEKTKKV